MSRVLAARAATRSCTAGSASAIMRGHSFLMVELQVAQAVTRKSQGAAGSSKSSRLSRTSCRKVWVSPPDRAGMPQQPWPAGRWTPTPWWSRYLEHGVGHLGIELVDEAAHEKGHLEVGGPGSGVPPGDLNVPGDRRQGCEVPVGQQRRHEPGAGGAQEVVHRLDENPLEFGAPGQDAVEPVRLAEEPPEDNFFHRGQPQVARQDGPGLDEDIQDLDAGRTVGGAGAAQQAAAQMILDPLGVL